MTKAALLVIDAQELITTDKLYAFDRFTENVRTLIAEARANGVEVVYVRHDDGEGQPLSKDNAGFDIYSGFVPEAGERTDAILFDDITLYLSNMLYGKNAPKGSTAEKAAVVRQRMQALLDTAKACGRTVVFVSNEVGNGIVPENAMAREYRDISGWVNQQIGKEADQVFYVVAGQAVDIKRLAFKFE